MATQLIRRVSLVWSGLSGAPYFTQLFFGHEAGNATPTATAVKNLLNNLAPTMQTGLTVQQNPEQVIIDTALGEPVGLEVATAQPLVTCTATGDALPWATQGVVRLPTSIYNSGHRLRGHFFLPGMMEAANINGVVAAPTLTQYNGFLSTFWTATQTSGALAVWTRAHRGWASAEGAFMWGQWGVLRSRRPTS